jgi:Reverse transcriptase (RNA-dependent DNA polymerase)
MRSKLDNRGKACLYLGRAKDHAADVYRFLNLDSKRIIHSRDVTWLNRNYATFMNVDGVHVVDQDDLLPVETIVTTNTVTPVVPEPEPTVPVVLPVVVPVPDAPVPPIPAPIPVLAPPNVRVTRELNRLGADFADVDLSDHRSLRSGRVDDAANILVDGNIVPLSDVCMLTMDDYRAIFHDLALTSIDPLKLNPSQYKDYFLVPTNFNDAWNHPDEFQRKFWRDAIQKEFQKMDFYHVWKVVKRRTIPKGRKCVKHKWVFDIKRNGVFRARLVACGYSQQPGVDFTESFSPVINDSTFRTLIVLELVLKLKSRIIYIETAFLNGDLEEEIYMDAPDGLQLELCRVLVNHVYL